MKKANSNGHQMARLMKLEECPRLEEKYRGIVTLPLDFQKFEPDSWSDFWQIWNTEKEKVWRNHIDRGSIGNKNPSLDHTQWDGMSIYEVNEFYESGSWGSKISRPMIEANKNLIKDLIKVLPFLRIRSMRLWSAHTTIPPHYDGNMPQSLDGKMHFPTEIRIMLYDENPRSTFWLTSAIKHQPHTTVSIEDRYYIKLPTDTNSFAWNNETYLHAADFDPAYRKILLVVKGWIDINRLEELLDRSIAKYPDYIVREK